MKTSRNFASPRRAMTLIEIMSAILVLAIGLVGVLAAIPFGGMRMEQMQEADSAAAVGRNAIRLIKANDMANPSGWNWANRGANAYFSNTGGANALTAGGIGWNVTSVLETGNFDFTAPYFIDPLGKMAINDAQYQPEFVNLTPTDGFPTTITRVYPRLVPYQNILNVGSFQPGFNWQFASEAMRDVLRTNSARLRERYFYLQDDVFYGYYNGEDETEFRPGLETEADNITGGVVPAFSGRYSWMATVSPRPNTAPFYNCPEGDVATADFDVVVFKNRILGGEVALPAFVEGSGYQGGSVTLDLTKGFLTDDANVRNSINNYDYNFDAERVLEQLETTRYIMLIGYDDFPEDGSRRAFAKWYRIANYAVVDTNDGTANGVPAKLRLSLIGANAPRVWTAGNNITADGSALPVTALFFPGVVGVYSSSTTFTEL